MNNYLENCSIICYEDIQADIEPWIKFAIDCEDNDCLERIWPTLMKAGLTKIEKQDQYSRVLLMAIALTDLHGQIVQNIQGHGFFAQEYYDVIEESTGAQLPKLRQWLKVDETVTAEEIAIHARCDYLIEALNVLAIDNGDEFGVLELFLERIYSGSSDFTFMQMGSAFHVLHEAYSNYS